MNNISLKIYFSVLICNKKFFIVILIFCANLKNEFRMKGQKSIYYIVENEANRYL